MSKQEFGFSLGIFEVLTPKIIKGIREQAAKYKTYALGVYTDEYVQNELNTACMKTTEQRIEIAEQIDNVNFVFPVDTRDATIVKKEIEKAYSEYLELKKSDEQEKYKVGIAIGSYDMLHSGHIENIKLAKKQCEKLVAVVKSDERIKVNKNKIPLQTTQERANNVRELKSIDHVFFMNLETTRKDIIQEVLDFYGVDKSEIAVFLGSDLKDKEEKYKDEWEGVNLVFTKRDEGKMKIVSSSNYQKRVQLEHEGGIEDLNNFEDEHFNI